MCFLFFTLTYRKVKKNTRKHPQLVSVRVTDQLDLSERTQKERERDNEREEERERERVPRQPYKIKQNFSEKIFLLKSSVGKKEREHSLP